jgi:hypothetical protein
LKLRFSALSRDFNKINRASVLRLGIVTEFDSIY